MRTACRASARVYPRPHGEADTDGNETWDVSGLSPPTRGSLGGRGDDERRSGSIPAHTGKPSARRRKGTATTVYPRPHGEATLRRYGAKDVVGLSPPTRGSLGDRLEHRPVLGSIPAHTGKPPPGSRRRTQSVVYPRPHGEALFGYPVRINQAGLSPPTRGSRYAVGDGVVPERSIPAHTGKPPLRSRDARSRAVYPRPHGEALEAVGNLRCARGLSPPTRGSPFALCPSSHTSGSIPAHTGKPWTR